MIYVRCGTSWQLCGSAEEVFQAFQKNLLISLSRELRTVVRVGVCFEINKLCIEVDLATAWDGIILVFDIRYRIYGRMDEAT